MLTNNTFSKISNFFNYGSKYFGQCLHLRAANNSNTFEIQKDSLPKFEINQYIKTGYSNFVHEKQLSNFCSIDIPFANPVGWENQKDHFNYFQMDGNIACLVNGSSLALTSLDEIRKLGGVPASLFNLGGNVSEAAMIEGLTKVTQNPKVKVILINIFGETVKCDIIAKNIIAAVQTVGIKVPIVVKLEGNNVECAHQILNYSGLSIFPASSLNKACSKAINTTSTCSKIFIIIWWIHFTILFYFFFFYDDSQQSYDGPFLSTHTYIVHPRRRYSFFIHPRRRFSLLVDPFDMLFDE